MNLFGIRDKRVGAYTQPFWARSKGEAMRMFIDTINDKTSAIYKYPTDFELHWLAEWDEVDGTFDLDGSPSRMLTGLEALEEPPPRG